MHRATPSFCWRHVHVCGSRGRESLTVEYRGFATCGRRGVRWAKRGQDLNLEHSPIVSSTDGAAIAIGV